MKPTDPAAYRRIVVAYDGSERSEDALALALRLRERCAGALTLACVRVARLPCHAPSPSSYPTGGDDEAIDLMLANARKAVPRGIHVRTAELVATSAARGLTELAETEAADLVVIGSSAHAAPGGVSMERTAGRLLHGAPCAVAVPPAGANDSGPFRHIGVAFDGSPESLDAVATGYALAARDGAAITIVRALPPVATPESGTPVDERLERRRALAARRELEAVTAAAPAGVNPRVVLGHGDPLAVVHVTCDGVVDLLVCGSRGYGPLRRAFLGSVSEGLMEGAPHPVLVLPRAHAPAESAASLADRRVHCVLAADHDCGGGTGRVRRTTEPQRG